MVVKATTNGTFTSRRKRSKGKRTSRSTPPEREHCIAELRAPGL